MPKATGTMTKAEAEAQLASNLEKLPEFCFSVNETTDSLILIKRGETGFWPAKNYSKGALATWDAVADLLNEKHGVTLAQREAMIAGSIFGFHVKGADPDSDFHAAKVARKAARSAA